MALTTKQRGVLGGMIPALGVTIVALAGAVIWQPAWVTPANSTAARIAFTLKWDVLVVACLAISIGTLARHRFFTKEDIDGGGMSAQTEAAKILQSILQNTLEQAVLAVVAHLVWSVAAPPGWLAAVPVAAVLFALGRLLFARGYRRGAPARALGFGLTFYPSVLMLLAGICLVGIDLLAT